MLHRKIKKALSTKSAKGLTAASIWQLANYVLPLITFPYLARILGVEGFGIIGTALAIIGNALTVTDWGFGTSASQSIAKHRNDPVKVNAIFWDVFGAKIILGSLCLVAIGIGAFVFTKDVTFRYVLAIASLNIVGSMMNVDWALKGMERIGDFATASIIGRSTAVPCVFLLVKDASDLPEAVFGNSIGAVAVGILSIIFLRRTKTILAPAFSLKTCLTHIKDGTGFFLSNASMMFYNNCLALVLGMTSGPYQVGLFTSADRIRRPAHMMLSPIGMVFSPRMSFLSVDDQDSAQKVAKRLLVVQGGLAFLISLGLCVCAPIIVPLLLGPGFAPVTIVLQVLSWYIFINGVSNVFGLMIMLPFGYRREFNLALVIGSVVGAVFVAPLSMWYGAVGTAMAALVAELVVAGCMFFTLNRRLDWFRPKPRS